MPSYTFACESCDILDVVYRSISSRDEPCLCPACTLPMQRRLESPHPLRRSLLDGQRRGDGYQELKQAARLKVERASLPRDSAEFREVTSAINTLEKSK